MNAHHLTLRFASDHFAVLGTTVNLAAEPTSDGSQWGSSQEIVSGGASEITYGSGVGHLLIEFVGLKLRHLGDDAELELAHHVMFTQINEEDIENGTKTIRLAESVVVYATLKRKGKVASNYPVVVYSADPGPVSIQTTTNAEGICTFLAHPGWYSIAAGGPCASVEVPLSAPWKYYVTAEID